VNFTILRVPHSQSKIRCSGMTLGLGGYVTFDEQKEDLCCKFLACVRGGFGGVWLRFEDD
jgi:hypothetical protein